MKLLSAAAAGNGATVEKSQWGNRQLDQFHTVYVWGTFGGSTVTLQVSPDGTNWFSSGFTATAALAQNVEFRARYVRGVVAGGAGQAVEMLLL